MMDELRALKAAVEPREVLLVADGMTGQDAVKIARGFQDGVGLTGVILTKLDGDAVALVEKAAANIDAEAAQKLEKKVRSKKGMDLHDFLVALKQMQSMGP